MFKNDYNKAVKYSFTENESRTPKKLANEREDNIEDCFTNNFPIFFKQLTKFMFKNTT
jgi:hypothetical protein